MLRVLTIFLGLTASLPIASAALEFSGYMKIKAGAQFIITDVESGSKSGWLSIGDSFLRHKIVSFDERNETIVLEVDGEAVRLSLKDSRVLEGKSAASQKIDVKLFFSQKGELSIDGRTLSTEGFLDLLRKETESGRSVALSIHMPDDPSREASEGFKRLYQSLGKSGLKKWSLRIIDGSSR